MMVIGLGAKSTATAADMTVALAEMMSLCGRPADRIATRKAPKFATALMEAAAPQGLPVQLISDADLKRRGPDCATHSERSFRLFGVGSVAEAAALAAAGEGSALIAPRRIIGGVTVAIAMSRADVEAAL